MTYKEGQGVVPSFIFHSTGDGPRVAARAWGMHFCVQMFEIMRSECKRNTAYCKAQCTSPSAARQLQSLIWPQVRSTKAHTQARETNWPALFTSCTEDNRLWLLGYSHFTLDFSFKYKLSSIWTWWGIWRKHKTAVGYCLRRLILINGGKTQLRISFMEGNTFVKKF